MGKIVFYAIILPKTITKFRRKWKLHQKNVCTQKFIWLYFYSSANHALNEVNYINNTAWTTLFPSQVPIRSVQSLQLSGIPFYCNCSLTWLWELYQQNHSEFHLDEAVCHTVSNSAQRNVQLKVITGLNIIEISCALQYTTKKIEIFSSVVMFPNDFVCFKNVQFCFN